MEYIKLNGLPDKKAKEAYEKGYYIEAIQILHGFLENQCQSLFMLVGFVHFNAKQEETYDLTDTIKLHSIIKNLYILNQISKKEYTWLNDLNTMRNKVTHQICKEPYEKEYLGIQKKEFDKI